MMEMIERVARAICEASGTIWGGPRGEDDPDFALPKAAYMNMARAAIEAVAAPDDVALVREFLDEVRFHSEFDEMYHGAIERIVSALPSASDQGA